MKEEFYIIPEQEHNKLVTLAYMHRGYSQEEAEDAAKFCSFASAHGVRTHNAIKALHLDELFGSGNGGCTPNSEIEILENRFAASEVWNCHKKLGQSVAYQAIEKCIELADKYGIGQVSVDSAFHYLWGGGYVLDAAKRGYIAYTNCTAGLAEVVPFMGKFPTLGTNPHSWAFPTSEAIGFPIVIDWATSVVAMGRVQQLKREGQELPDNAAVDKDGNPTKDPEKAAYLVPFGAHKGYGMALINEILASFIGGSLPTLRSREIPEGEKRTPSFYFQVIHPDAVSGGAFAAGRNQTENVRAVIEDIKSHGNEDIFLPGQDFAQAATRTQEAGGLLFSEAEIGEFNHIAQEIGVSEWDIKLFQKS